MPVRTRCFFDIEIDSLPLGRLVFELYNDTCPRTADNFRALCTGEKGVGQNTGKPLHYHNVRLHRVVRDFMIQGGDFSAGNGTGGESIYGGTFEDENLETSHDRPYLLSMANRGKNTNGSQFFITTQPAPHLDGVHVVFGHVIVGQELVSQLEMVPTDNKSRPLQDVRIARCGELVLQSKRKDKKKKPKRVSVSEDEKRKKKKSKKEKKSKKDKEGRRHRGGGSGENGAGEDADAADMSHPLVTTTHISPDDIPAVPTNRFLHRGDPDAAPTNGDELDDGRQRRRSQRHLDNSPSPNRGQNGRQRRRSRTIIRAGKRVKGRGFLRYYPVEATRSRSRTPPHWRTEQKRTIKLSEYEREKEEKAKRDEEKKRRALEREKRHRLQELAEEQQLQHGEAAGEPANLEHRQRISADDRSGRDLAVTESDGGQQRSDRSPQRSNGGVEGRGRRGADSPQEEGQICDDQEDAGERDDNGVGAADIYDQLDYEDAATDDQPPPSSAAADANGGGVADADADTDADSDSSADTAPSPRRLLRIIQQRRQQQQEQDDLKKSAGKEASGEESSSTSSPEPGEVAVENGSQKPPDQGLPADPNKVSKENVEEKGSVRPSRSSRSKSAEHQRGRRRGSGSFAERFRDAGIRRSRSGSRGRRPSSPSRNRRPSSPSRNRRERSRSRNRRPSSPSRNRRERSRSRNRRPSSPSRNRRERSRSGSKNRRDLRNRRLRSRSGSRSRRCSPPGSRNRQRSTSRSRIRRRSPSGRKDRPRSSSTSRNRRPRSQSGPRNRRPRSRSTSRNRRPRSRSGSRNRRPRSRSGSRNRRSRSRSGSRNRRLRSRSGSRNRRRVSPSGARGGRRSGSRTGGAARRPSDPKPRQTRRARSKSSSSSDSSAGQLKRRRTSQSPADSKGRARKRSTTDDSSD